MNFSQDQLEILSVGRRERERERERIEEGEVGVHEYPHDNMVVWNERGFAMCMAKGYGT